MMLILGFGPADLPRNYVPLFMRWHHDCSQNSLPPALPKPPQIGTPVSNATSTAPPLIPTQYTAGSEPSCSLVNPLPVADPGTVTGTGTPQEFPFADPTVMWTMERPSSE